MGWTEIVAVLDSPAAKVALPTITGVVGWFGNSLAGWWKSRDRYQAHVTWQGAEGWEYPAIIIQSVHPLPINVTRLRVRNGLRWKTGAYPYHSDNPDYPKLPITIGPMGQTTISLNETALNDAAKQCRLLRWLWVPRVYIGVQTMGRGERLFVAEGALEWNERRSRYRR